MPLCLNVLISLCHFTCDASAYTTIPFAVATEITDLAGAAARNAAAGLADIVEARFEGLLPMLRERRETLLSIPPNERGNLRRAPPRDRKEEAEP